MSDNPQLSARVSDSSSGLIVQIHCDIKIKKFSVFNCSIVSAIFHKPVILLLSRRNHYGDWFSGDPDQVLRYTLFKEIYSVLRDSGGLVYDLSGRGNKIELFLEGRYLGFGSKPFNLSKGSEILEWLEEFLEA